jgi:hypothetical protein
MLAAWESGGKAEPFLEVIFRRIMMIQNKNAPKCAQCEQKNPFTPIDAPNRVWGIDWRKRIFLFAPKPILGPVRGPFWPDRESTEGAKFRAEKMPKSGTLGNRRHLSFPFDDGNGDCFIDPGILFV